jgi:hypothetical protein
MHTNGTEDGCLLTSAATAVAPNAEPYEGFEGELKKRAERQGRLAAAQATPLPGPLAEAFADGKRKVCGFEMLPVVAAHMVILQQIGSPMLKLARIFLQTKELTEAEREKRILEETEKDRLARGETEGESAARLDVETVETFFVFITPPAEMRRLLLKGRPTFREAAMERVMDRLAPIELAELRVAVGAHFASAFATRVEYEAPPSDDGSFPSPPAKPMMGSVGG